MPFTRWNLAMANKALHIVALLATALNMAFRSVSATSYTVGDSFGWNLPSNGASTYSTWASSHTFHVGDVLVFNFVTGNHNVASVTQSDYNSCNTGSPISVMTNSPVSQTLNTTGSYYFICTFSNHCSQGMKLVVNVGTSSGPSSSPYVPPPPPRPRSSATSPSVAGAVAVAARVFLVLLQEFIL